MKKYRLAVCKGPECRSGGADLLFSTCRELLLQQGLATRCEAYRGGCYGLCHLGPNVVVREDRGAPRNPLAPENFQLMGWEGEHHYSAVNLEKLARIIGSTSAQIDRRAIWCATPKRPGPWRRWRNSQS